MTNRGFREREFAQIAGWIARVTEARPDENVIATIVGETRALGTDFPIR